MNDDKQGLSGVNEVIPVDQGLPVISHVAQSKAGVSGKGKASLPGVSEGQGMGLDIRQHGTFEKIKAIELLEKYPKNIAHICRMMGIHRNTWEYHINHDPDFRQEVEMIEEAHCDELEATMLHLGKEKTSFNFNDRIAYLRAHRPQLYNPARKIIVEGYKMSDGDAQRRAGKLDGAIDATIVNAYTDRKERLQAKREGSSLLPSSDQEGGGGSDGKV